MAKEGWRISRKAVATAVSLLLGASAQAKVGVGIFDPMTQFGIPGYQGTATFFVSDSCFNGSASGYDVFTGSGDCGVATLESATVYLYGPGPLPAPPPGGPTPPSTFSLGPSSLSVTGVHIIAGQIAGIDTTAGFSFAADPVHSGTTSQFTLQFLSGCLPGDPVANCGALFGPLFFGLGDSFGPAAVGAIPTVTLMDSQSDDPQGAQSIANIVFTTQPDATVPEPGTLGLILGALGGGWLARRRKKKNTA